EQIAEHGNARAAVRSVKTFRSLEQQRGSAGFEHAIADLGHLEALIDLDANALELAAAFELDEKVAEIGVFHRTTRDGTPSARRSMLPKRSLHPAHARKGLPPPHPACTGSEPARNALSGHFSRENV